MAGTSEPEMRLFDDFWPFYVREHADPTNRVLHVVGTTLAMGCVAAGLLTRRRSFFVAAPVVGYGFAWVGHFLIQGNKPATFKYPLWSLRGDFEMWWKTMNGTMAAEVERVTSSNGVSAEDHHDAAPVSQTVN